MKGIRILNTEIKYYENYKKQINNLLYEDSEKLTIDKYMLLVDETKEIQTYINHMEQQQDIIRNEFIVKGVHKTLKNKSYSNISQITQIPLNEVKLIIEAR